MPVTMICPNLNCRCTVVAPDSARGKVVRCVHCKQLFMVPARTEDRNAPADLIQPDEEAGTRGGKKPE
jgi:hypothetical protein